jgi:hypothetical protein
MFSPGYWLMSSIWFLLTTRLVGIVRWGKTASLYRVVRAVFISQQPCCPSAAALFGQLLPQQCEAIPFWMLPSVPEISSRIYHLSFFGRLACHSTPALSLYASPSLYWVLAAPLGGWLVTLVLFLAFGVLDHFEFPGENLAPRPPCSLG